jgi:hypothetical protein
MFCLRGALICCLGAGFFLPGCKADIATAPRLSGAPVRIEDITMDTITLSWDPAEGPYPVKYRVLDAREEQAYQAILKNAGKTGGIPAIEDYKIDEKESGYLDGHTVAHIGDYWTFVNGMDISETRVVLKNLSPDFGYYIVVLALNPSYTYSVYPQLSFKTLTMEEDAAKKAAAEAARIRGLAAEYERITAGMDSESRALNDAGYREYEQGRYREAAKLFRAAIVFDAGNILPHYNLACVLALLRGKGEEVDLSEIENELKICFSLDPALSGRPADWILARIREDGDLDSIRDMEFFRAIASYDHSRLYSKAYEDKRAWLCGGPWVGGADIFTFQPDRTFSFTVEFEYGMRGSGKWRPDGGDENGFYISFYEDEFLAESGMDGSWYYVSSPDRAYLNLSEMSLSVWWEETEQIYRQRDASLLWSAVEENAAAEAAGFLRAGYPVNQRRFEYWESGGDSILTPALANKNAAMIRLLAGYGLTTPPELLPALHALDPELGAAVIYRAVKTENAPAAELLAGNRPE